MSLFRRLAAFFIDEAPPPSSPPPPGPAAGDDVVADTVDALQRELAQMGDDSKAAIEGRIHLLDFRPLATQVVSNVATFHQAARSAIDAVAARHLAPRDYTRIVDDLCVLIVFHAGSKERCELMCATVGQEVLYRLLGDGADVDDVQVHSAERTEDGDVVLVCRSLADLLPKVDEQANSHAYTRADALHVKLAGGDRPPASPPAPDRGPRWQPLTIQREAIRSGQISDAVRKRLMSAIDNLQAGFDGLEADLAALRLLEPAVDEDDPRPALVARDRLDNIAEDQAATPPSHERLGLDFWFEPYLDIASWRISTYTALVGVRLPDGEAARPCAALRGLDEQLRARFDKLGVQRAVCELLSADDFGRVNLICVQAHYSTLMMNQARRDLLDLCTELPERLCNRLVWEVVGVPEKSWANGLEFVAGSLRPFARAILVNADPSLVNVGDLGPLRAHAVGIDLERQPLDPATLTADLQRFAARAGGRGLRAYVSGCTGAEMVRAAVEAGFTYAAGSAISPRLMTSAAARQLAADEMVADVAKPG